VKESSVTTPFGAGYDRTPTALPEDLPETFGQLPGNAVDLTLAAVPAGVRAPRLLMPDVAPPAGAWQPGGLTVRTDPGGRLGAALGRLGGVRAALAAGVRRRYEAVERRATGQLDTTG
jgi:hypothetical protein